MIPSSDTDLLTRIREGDESAFTELVNRHHAGLVRLCRNYVSSTAHAEEIAQDTWLAALKGLEGFEGFEGRSALKTWLYGVAINLAKTRGVKESRTTPLSAIGDGEVSADRFSASGHWSTPPSAWLNDNPERVLDNKEAMAIVQATLQSLPLGQREVLQLRDIDQLDTEEVCNLLQLTETNQRVLLHRARTTVRAALEKHFSNVSAGAGGKGVG